MIICQIAIKCIRGLNRNRFVDKLYYKNHNGAAMKFCYLCYGPYYTMNNTVLSNSHHVEQKQASCNKSRIIGLHVVVLKNKIKKSETASSLETGENQVSK